MRPDHRLFSIITILLIVLLPAGLFAAERLTILHVNDFHGRVYPSVDKAVDKTKPFGGAAYLAEIVRKEREQNPKGTILLSAGDMFQGTPVSNLFGGRPVLEVMNVLGFDAMALGNHEFDWGFDALGEIVAAARFPMLCANLVDDKGIAPAGVRPYVMIERKGVRVAVIGVITTDLAHMVGGKHHVRLKVAEPSQVVPQLVRKAKGEGAQVVILLSHMGLEQDRRLAAAVKGIDVIVGGHSHTAMTHPVFVGKTMIVQAGSNGLSLGVVDLAIDEKTGKVIEGESKARLKSVSAGPDDVFDKEIARVADTYGERIKDKFRQVVGETKVDLTRQQIGESTMGNAITDAIRASTGAEIAFHNAGGIRADILAGKITMEQVYTVLPFDNVVISMDLSGADLLDIFEKGATTNKGMLQVSGAHVEYDLYATGERKVSAVYVNGAPLEKDRRYRVATNDFLAAGGDGLGGFARGRNIAYWSEIRDVFAEYLKSHSPLEAPKGGRIVIRKR